VGALSLAGLRYRRQLSGWLQPAHEARRDFSLFKHPLSCLTAGDV